MKSSLKISKKNILQERTFTLRYIRFSCDSCSQLPYFERAVEMFERHRISKSKVFIYILVRSDLQEADFRVQEMNRICISFSLYAQAERNGHKGIMPNTAQLEFAQRYVYGKCYKKENWREYCQRKGFDY